MVRNVSVPENATVFTLHMQMIGVSLADTPYYWNLWNDSRTNNVADWNRFLDAIALEKI